jgi:hypothetical protein
MKFFTAVSVIILLIIFTANNYSQEFDFFEPKTTVSGYGELHYNNEKVEGKKRTQVLDFHRFVLFFGHAWSEKWSLKSEVELEHNFVKNGQGEIELEQAYVNYHHADWLGFQAGVILPSAGLINEYHEPPLFFGVERPDYHNKIIPTTWFGNGIAFYGNYNGFDYKFVIMEGLNADKFSASSGIRGGRQKGFMANVENPLYNFRLDYLGFPGLKVGASYSYNNAIGDSTTNEIGLAEFHLKYEANNFYGVFELGNISYKSGEIKSSRGYYFDLGYNLSSHIAWETKVIPFFRYSDINTAASTRSGGDSEKAYHIKQWMVGLSVKPLPAVVFKADFGEIKRELGDVKTSLFNLGVGYMF